MEDNARGIMDKISEGVGFLAKYVEEFDYKGLMDVLKKTIFSQYGSQALGFSILTLLIFYYIRQYHTGQGQNKWGFSKKFKDYFISLVTITGTTFLLNPEIFKTLIQSIMKHYFSS